jgi:hypothetical protein
VAELRRQAVSIRLAHGDIRNIKRFAKRLGVRDSDIVRFAIKSTFSRLAPLCDPAIRGRNLVPVLAEAGDEIIRHFDLDAFQLEAIINDQVDPKDQVERDDIVLLAMSSLRQEYLRMRLNDDGQASTATSPDSLRRYLYEKYIYRDGNARRALDTVDASDGAARADATSPQPAIPAR